MKTKNKKKIISFSKILTIIFCTLAIGLTFSLADLFSSLITVGGFTFTSSDISIAKYTTYAVCTKSATTQASATEYANLTKQQGGAGYLYLANDCYNVVASIYENRPDAEKVVSNLKENNITSFIVQIDIPAISLNSNLTEQEKTTLENSINIFKNTYKQLYDISISLDTAIITEVNAKLTINKLGSDVLSQINNFNTIFGNTYNVEFLNIKTKLNKLSENINELISTSVPPLTSHIKYTYCSALFLLKDLAK